MTYVWPAAAATLLLCPTCPSTATASAAASVDHARIVAADDEPGQWLTHGRTYGEQRYSPLDAIHGGNVEELSLAWSFDVGSKRGLEATPIVVDGVMYVSGAWSKVFALDAASGRLLWEYDPKVPRSVARKACCDVVNRGVAAWEGRIYFGTLDGRLVALDARDGSLVWEVMTVDPALPYTITGAPRVLKGKVLIGNGGAEYGVRGYVGAYDAETGERIWRFYTVPGNPQHGFESDVCPAPRRPAETSGIGPAPGLGSAPAARGLAGAAARLLEMGACSPPGAISCSTAAETDGSERSAPGTASFSGATTRRRE